MRAVVIQAHGGPEVLEVSEVPTPEPRPQEIRVRVAACGLNHLDLWVRGGLPNLKLPFPHILGGDVAGVVEAVGSEVHNVTPGQRVVLNPGVSCGTCRACLAGQDNLCRRYGIIGEHRWGGTAEYVVAPAVNAVHLPEHVGFTEAASLPVTFLTAWQMVAHKARIRPGETALVQGASSGVGVALVQIAQLFGARVFATASTEAKREAALGLGASQAFDSTAPDLSQQVRSACRGGVDAVFEHVGTATWAHSVSALRFAGRLVTCGATTGGQVELNLVHLFYKAQSLLGSTMGSKGELLELLRHVEAGRLDCVGHGRVT